MIFKHMDLNDLVFGVSKTPIVPLPSTNRDFFAENFSVSVPGTSTGTVIATINVPIKCRFRLLSLGNYIDSVAAWGFITWHFNCNGTPQAPYHSILDQIGYAAQRQETQHLEFGGGSIITITADNTTAAPVAVGISISWELIYQE